MHRAHTYTSSSRLKIALGIFLCKFLFFIV
nr:MAG TPA: hypothetical protein [Caudoviricetes sp.]